MRYIFDTNIILHIVRNSSLWNSLKSKFDFDNSQVFISIVTYAEIKSIAKQLGWGNKKHEKLEQVLKHIPKLYINSKIAELYVEIDVFSQNKDKNNPLSKNITARNMGKNDLWIAATTKYIDAELITTDKDFLHLKNIFTVHTIKQ